MTPLATTRRWALLNPAHAVFQNLFTAASGAFGPGGVRGTASFSLPEKTEERSDEVCHGELREKSKAGNGESALFSMG